MQGGVRGEEFLDEVLRGGEGEMLVRLGSRYIVDGL